MEKRSLYKVFFNMYHNFTPDFSTTFRLQTSTIIITIITIIIIYYYILYYYYNYYYYYYYYYVK